MQRDVRRCREQVENCRQETAERTEVTNPKHTAKEDQSEQKCTTRRNSGVQGYNPSDGHRRMDKRGSRLNRLVNGPPIVEDYHQTGIDQNAHSNKRPSNGGHSAADDRTTKQSNQLQTTSTKNHGHRHCTESTNCSTHGTSKSHPGNQVRRKDDSVGQQRKSRSTDNECEDPMGRHSPHITPDWLPRHISSETVYTRSDTVLPLPEVRPHKQDVSSDRLNLRYLRGQTQYSRMHRKTKDSDNPTEMQQLQRSAHNGIKSLSCTETKSTSNPEVYPGDASQVRQKTTSAQAEQPEFIPTMLDFPDAQKSLKSKIPRAATTLKQTHGQTKKSYADIIKDKLVTFTTQKPVVNKQTTKTKKPANKEIAKTEGPVNKSQATNSTETPQQSEPREATVTQTYEQVAMMLIAQMQQLTPLFSVKETKAKHLIVAMIQSIQSLLKNLETML